MKHRHAKIIDEIVEFMDADTEHMDTDAEDAFEKYFTQAGYHSDHQMYDFVWAIWKTQTGVSK